MPQILSVLILLAVAVSPVFGQARANPIYLKVELAGMLADPYGNALPDVQKEIAELIIQHVIQEGLDADYPWDFQPADPAQNQHPLLTISVLGREMGRRTDNWLMSLHFEEGPNQGQFRKQFPTVTLLEEGQILAGTAPDEDQRKGKIYEWFREHYARKDGTESLKQILQGKVPLANGYVQPQNTNPPLGSGMGVVFLGNELYGKLCELTFEWRCIPVGQGLQKWISHGQGWFTQVVTPGGAVEGIVVRHQAGPGVNLNGLIEAQVYLNSVTITSNGTF